MKVIRMIIADPDRDYSSALCNWILQNKKDSFQIDIFTAADSLKGFFIESGAYTDIVLATSRIYESVKDICKCNCIILFDHQDKEKEGISGYIEKYQPMERLITDVLEIYSESRDVQGGGKVNISCGNVCFFSPIGGAGTSTLAAAFSMFLADGLRKIFYLNLEENCSQEYFFPHDNYRTLSDVFYYLKQGKDNLFLKLESCKTTDPLTNIDYFLKASSMLEWKEMKDEEIVKLIKCIQGMNYDNLIVDMPCSCKWMLLEHMTKIVLVLGNNHMAAIKLRTFLESVKIYQEKKEIDLIGRIHTVINRCDGTVDPVLSLINNYGMDDFSLLGEISELHEGIFASDYLNEQLKKLYKHIYNRDLIGVSN